MSADRITLIEEAFKRRYMNKKLLNLAVCGLIAVLGITSFIYIWTHDREGALVFRWLTVDGTLFTTAIAVFYVAVGIMEISRYTELTSRVVYFTRLSSAVAECIILIVVLISQLPIFSEHMHIFRYDMFNMHILIPILTVASFIMNDSPIGKLSVIQKFRGTWFVTVYAAVVISLIVSDVIRTEQIPYFFMDVKHLPPLSLLGYILFIYCLGYLLSHSLSTLNRKLSWLWFKNIASSVSGE